LILIGRTKAVTVWCGYRSINMWSCNTLFTYLALDPFVILFGRWAFILGFKKYFKIWSCNTLFWSFRYFFLLTKRSLKYLKEGNFFIPKVTSKAHITKKISVLSCILKGTHNFFSFESTLLESRVIFYKRVVKSLLLNMSTKLSTQNIN
jgi:hypothetical protein